jgi:hypothetical protein
MTNWHRTCSFFDSGNTDQQLEVEGRKEGATPMRKLGRKSEEGKIGYIILWLMGVPVSVLLIIFLLRGCT